MKKHEYELESEIDDLIDGDLFGFSGKLWDLADKNDDLMSAIYSLLSACATVGDPTHWHVQNAIKAYQITLRKALEPEALALYELRYPNEDDDV